MLAASLPIPRLVPRARITHAELIAEGRVRLADGTLLSCANYPGCASHSHFVGEAGIACGQQGALLFCDKGLWGRELDGMLKLTDVELIIPERHRLGERPPAELEKARIRLVIESLFANLKCQTRLDNHLAKTLGGLVQRIAQRLLALTLGMPCNLHTGRPARALVAYDGRRTHISPLAWLAPDANSRQLTGGVRVEAGSPRPSERTRCADP